MDLLLNAGSERSQHHAQFQVNVEVGVSNVQMTLHSTALESEMIAFPLIVHIELLRQILGQGFRRLAGMIFIKGMGAMDIDNRHGSGFSGN